MPLNNPVPRTGTPRTYEGSDMRSPRDSDDLSRVWIKNGQTMRLADDVARTVATLSQEVRKLKRRRLGGGTGATGFGMTFQGEYAWSASIAQGDVYIVSAGANAGTYICIESYPAESNPPWTGGPGWCKLPTADASIGTWL